MMKTLLMSTVVLFAVSSASFAFAPAAEGISGYTAKTTTTVDLEAKRSKPRVPGGSGCDDPRDVIEHPECRRADAETNSVIDELEKMEAKRSKPRVPGGSGCDDPRDVIEHPECRRT